MTILPCKRAREGGDFRCAQTGCRSCLEKLIVENEGLIHAYLRRQEIGGMVYADLVQEGRIALWQAVLKYEPERGPAFSSYAWAAIGHQVWRAVRQANQSYLWQEGVEPWLGIAGIAEKAVRDTALEEALRVAVTRLPERLGKVLVWVYGLDGQLPRSMAALGREWGLSRERIRQLRNDALVLLRLPSFSAEVRDYAEQTSRAAYRQVQRLNRKWLGRRRKP